MTLSDTSCVHDMLCISCITLKRSNCNPEVNSFVHNARLADVYNCWTAFLHLRVT